MGIFCIFVDLCIFCSSFSVNVDFLGFFAAAAECGWQQLQQEKAQSQCEQVETERALVCVIHTVYRPKL